MKIIPFEILSLENDGYHILIQVELFNKKFKMVLDTGASKTVLDKELLFESGLTQDKLIESNVLSTGLGTNEMKSYSAVLDSFKIGSWEIKKFNVAVLDLSSINYAYRQMNLDPVMGVLGGDIMNQYGAIINYRKKTMRLNERKYKEITLSSK